MREFANKAQKNMCDIYVTEFFTSKNIVNQLRKDVKFVNSLVLYYVMSGHGRTPDVEESLKREFSILF